MTRRPASHSSTEAMSRVDAAIFALAKLIARQVVAEGQAVAFQDTEDPKHADSPDPQR